MVFLSFSLYNGYKLKTGTWRTRPKNSPPCMCYSNGSSAVLVSRSCLWGTSVKLERGAVKRKNEEQFLQPPSLQVIPPSYPLSTILQDKSLNYNPKEQGTLTFQVFSLLNPLLTEGERPFLCSECGKPIELQLMDGITHVSGQTHQTFHDQALIFYIASPTPLVM